MLQIKAGKQYVTNEGKIITIDALRDGDSKIFCPKGIVLRDIERRKEGAWCGYYYDDGTYCGYSEDYPRSIKEEYAGKSDVQKAVEFLKEKGFSVNPPMFNVIEIPDVGNAAIPAHVSDNRVSFVGYAISFDKIKEIYEAVQKAEAYNKEFDSCAS